MFDFFHPVINKLGYSVVSLCRVNHKIWSLDKDGSRSLLLDVIGNCKELPLDIYDHTVSLCKVLCHDSISFPSDYPKADVILIDGMPIDRLHELCAHFGNDFLDRLYAVALGDKAQFSVLKPACDCYGFYKVGSLLPPSEYLRLIEKGGSPSLLSMGLSVEKYGRPGADFLEFLAADELQKQLDHASESGAHFSPTPASESDKLASDVIARQWAGVLEHLENREDIPYFSFNAWLQDLAPVSFRGGCLVLQGPPDMDSDALTYVVKTYGSLICDAVTNVCGIAVEAIEEVNTCTIS